ncbi:MAG: hypothetical protein ABG776_04425 [Cyanobacteria bacterium J06555_13]
MARLFPVLLPAFLGLVAGFSQSMIADYVEAPTSLGETMIESLSGGDLGN